MRVIVARNETGLSPYAAPPPEPGSVPPNPLAFLRRVPRETVRRMQLQLSHARWQLSYRETSPSAVHSLVRELDGLYGGSSGSAVGL